MNSCKLREKIFLRRDLIRFYESDNELVFISFSDCEPVSDVLKSWVDCDDEIYVLAVWREGNGVRSAAAERILQSNMKSNGYEIQSDEGVYFGNKKAGADDVGDVVRASPRWKGVTFYLVRGNIADINGTSFRTHGISCRLRESFVAIESEGIDVAAFVTHVDGCEIHVLSKRSVD